jgi:putative ABC transport system substrate-binding protein
VIGVFFNKEGVMRRISCAVLLCAVLILSGCAKKREEVKRVSILVGIEAFSDIAEGFKTKMTELGYREGENIVYDVQRAHFDMALYRGILARFVTDKVDLIFAFPSEASLEAKQAAFKTNIPVVFAIAGIEGNDLVASIRHPGGNITGVRYPGPDLVAKRFEILMELAPSIKRLYVPYDPNYPNSPPSLAALRSVASSYGVTLVESQVHSIEDIQAAFESQAQSADIGMDAIQILPELITQTPAGWQIISEFAFEHNLPLVGSMLASAQSGGIFSYCVDFFEVGMLAAPLADKIFKGTPAGTIPVATPEAHLWLNYNVIQRLGLSAPEGLLNRADKIIR